MKFSTAMSLGMSPLALGKAVNNIYPRDGHLQVGGVSKIEASEAQLAELARLIGLNKGSGTSINFLWVNIGGGAATTVLGAASTVTVTQTVAHGGAATAPPAVVTGDAGTTTLAAPAPGTTVVAGGATHSVTVGGPQGLAFSPPQLSAAVGDTVIFTVLSQNHTATQSAFDTPCVALDGGMDSGYQANPNNTVNPPPQVAMQVMVDTPLWFYCRQGNHCGRGMVFSINPTAEKTHAQFQALAIQQNGNGAGSAITGNPPAADPNASASAGASASSASASGTLAPLPGVATTATDAAAGAANTGVATGTGTIAADGSCVCAVQCSFGGFPNQAVQGRDSFGGWGGAVPMAMVQAPPAARKRYAA
ncbi:Cupredoxin [Parathielavia appendiculata]|uniref:Cupredoxin n=1 Tax=Parathielavia appendiculata TaxID=2587402 RepID=A0AAN6Z2N5_9PEZI|nr:Cupredoxin [Parathielavia appendiculata]